MDERMTIETYRAITESAAALEHRLRYNARKLAETRALVARLEAQQVELTERLAAARSVEELA
jgi:hypothetical protein